MSWLFSRQQRGAIDPHRIAHEHAVATTLELSPFGVPIRPATELGFRSRMRKDDMRPVKRSLAAEDNHGIIKHARLLGGASTTATDANASLLQTTPTIAAKAAPEKWISLYGFQGAVMFNIYDDYSLIDAIVRLAAPQVLLNLGFYEMRAPRDGGPNDEPATFTYEFHVDVRTQDYCRDKIRTVFGPRDAEKTHALFIYAPDEQPPPPDRWKPGWTDDDDSNVVVRCVRSEYSELKDVAYLRLPSNAASLRSNQYIIWLMVVARILTPGSGLRMLRLDDLGMVAHSFVGLNDSSHADLVTHGCAGFSHWSWRELVQDVSKGSRLAVLDVMPLDRATLAVVVPGLNQGLGGRANEPDVLVELRGLDADPGDLYGSHNRVVVTECINSVVDASTTAAEKDKIQYCTVWGSGAIWLTDCAPLHKFPLEPQWIDFPTDAGLSSGFVVVRPGYTTYTAHVIGHADDGAELGGGGSSRNTRSSRNSSNSYSSVQFEFAMDETLETFRQRLRDAGLGRLVGKCLRISQQDPNSQRHSRTARYKKMTDDDRKCNNRMEFNLEPTADNNTWLLICSQIVGSDIWITEESDNSILDNVDLAKNLWGYRASYDNMLSRSQHLEAAKNRPGVNPALAASAALREPARRKTAGSIFQDSALKGEFTRKHLTPAPLVGGQNGQDGQDGQDGSGNGASSSSWQIPLEMFLRGGPDALPFVVGRAVATPSETAALNIMAADLYDLALQRVVPCPLADSGCQSFFVAGQTLAIHAHLAKDHPQPQQCNFCEHVFAVGASVADKLGHLAGTHAALFAADGGDGQGGMSAQQQQQQNGLPGGDDGDGGPLAAKKRRQQVSAGRQSDPLYRPGRDGDGSTDDSSDEGEGEDGVDDIDDLVDANRSRKRKRVADDPTYRPTKDGDGDGDEDVDEEEAEGRKDGAAPSSKTKRDAATSTQSAPRPDSSYRPDRKEGGPDYSEDADEELRRSAAPEWGLDPLDPTGKRKRVIREKPEPAPEKTAKASEEKKATKKTTKAAEKSKAQAARSAIKKASKAEPAETGRRRSSRVRKPVA